MCMHRRTKGCLLLAGSERFNNPEITVCKQKTAGYHRFQPACHSYFCIFLLTDTFE